MRSIPEEASLSNRFLCAASELADSESDADEVESGEEDALSSGEKWSDDDAVRFL